MTLVKPVLHLWKPEGSERYVMDYRHPDRIVKCKSKEDLEGLLRYYEYPFIAHRVPDKPEARRRYVEQVRPALRWFCKKYGANIPTWLEGDGHYGDMDTGSDDYRKFFGSSRPLHVREFNEHGSGEDDKEA